MWVRMEAVLMIRIDRVCIDRYAVGQNVATTWTFKRMPPSRDSPEFRRHIMGWFDEVRFTLASVCIILRQCIMLGEQVQVEVSRYFSLHVPDGYRALHSGMVWWSCSYKVVLL